jgi:hypothetical protein
MADRARIAVWSPLVEQILYAVNPAVPNRVSIYLRDPFIGKFYLHEAFPDGGPSGYEAEAVQLAVGVLERNRELPGLAVHSTDIMLGPKARQLASPCLTLVLPFTGNNGPIEALLALSLHDGTAFMPAATDKLQNLLLGFMNILKTVLHSQTVGDVCEILTHGASLTDYRSLLSKLVPDAFAGQANTLLGACAVLEGNAQMGNRVIFDRVAIALSPQILADIAHRELLLWAFGKPHALFGCGSANSPQHCFGLRLSKGDLAVFGIEHDLTPSAPLTADVWPEDLDDATGDGQEAGNYIKEKFKSRVTTDSAGRGDPLGIAHLPFSCLAQKCERAVVDVWNHSHGVLGAFVRSGANPEILLLDSKDGAWLNSVKHELSDWKRGEAWLFALADLVQCSARNKKDCVFTVVDGVLYEKDRPQSQEPRTVHGGLLVNGSCIRLCWSNDTCTCTISYAGETILSKWRLATRYWPVAVVASGCSTQTSLETVDIVYPPAKPHLILVQREKGDSLHWVPTDPAWRSDHVQAVTTALSSSAEFWLNHMCALVAVPLTRRGSETRLTASEWCAGSGPRKLLVAGIPNVGSGWGPGRADAVLGITEVVQQRLGSDIHNDIWNLDRVFVEHIRHDLAALRSGFTVVSEAATRPSEASSAGAQEDKVISRAIGDVEDKLASLEMICSLYDQIETPTNIDLEALEGSVTYAIRRAAVRARKKLGLDPQDENRLANLVSYDPPPPSRSLPHPDRLAVIVLENIIGNAIAAAEATGSAVESPGSSLEPAVRVERTDGGIIVRNRCHPKNWEFAVGELRAEFPRSRGLSVVARAARLGGLRIVPGDSAEKSAEIHVIPRKSTP